MSSDPIEVLRELAASWHRAALNCHECGKPSQARVFRECAAQVASALASLSAPKPESAEAVAWNEMEARAAPPRPEASEGQADATFAEWLASEMPAGTVIGNPAWWADRIARQYARRCAPQQASAPVGVDGAMVERAAEAAWLEFKSGLEERSWERAPAVRKDRLRIIVRTALTAALAGQQQGGES